MFRSLATTPSQRTARSGCVGSTSTLWASYALIGGYPRELALPFPGQFD